MSRKLLPGRRSVPVLIFLKMIPGNTNARNARIPSNYLFLKARRREKPGYAFSAAAIIYI
jgi:hypothetical protein